MHICCRSYRKTDLAELGTGVCLYFKMLKFLMGLFLLFTVLSIPQYYFYWAGNNYLMPQPNTDFNSIDYILSSLTIGNLGEAQISCTSSKVSAYKPVSINMTCSFGTFSEVNEFGLSTNETSCTVVDYYTRTLNLDPKCNSKVMPSRKADNFRLFFAQTCFNRSQCVLSFKFNDYFSDANCWSQISSKSNIFFLQATC